MSGVFGYESLLPVSPSSSAETQQRQQPERGEDHARRFGNRVHIFRGDSVLLRQGGSHRISLVVAQRAVVDDNLGKVDVGRESVRIVVCPDNILRRATGNQCQGVCLRGTLGTVDEDRLVRCCLERFMYDPSIRDVRAIELANAWGVDCEIPTVCALESDAIFGCWFPTLSTRRQPVGSSP